MARALFQVLVFPFFIDKVNRQIEYAIFKRSDINLWQGISGGGEDDESFLEAAQRETFEESGIGPDSINILGKMARSGWLIYPILLQC